VTNSMDKLRVGIIGAGRVGIDWHLPDVRAAGGEVVALADSVAGRAGRFAAQHGVPNAYDDPLALIHAPEVDIVAICTPPVAHEELALAAIAAGKYVYLEKPPAMNEAEMQRIADAAQAAGRPMMVGSNNIYHNDIQTLKRWIDAGTLGKIYAIEGEKIIRWRTPQGWHRIKAIGGGGVAFNSTAHRIDLVLYLLNDAKPVGVTGMTFDHFKHLTVEERSYVLRDVEEGLMPPDGVADVEDMLMMLIQFENGCTVWLRDASTAHQPDQMRLGIFGTQAGATLWPLAIHSTTPHGIETDTSLNVPPGPKGAHVQAYQHFFRCIREDTPTWSPPERAVLIMRIIDALYSSAEQGGRQVWLGS